MINSNLPSTLDRFQVTGMADYWSNFSIDMGVPHFNAPAGDDPLRLSGYTLPLQKLEGLSYQMLKTALIASSFVWTQYRNMTDRETDGIPLASTALCIASNATCCKNNAIL